ncbi:MAG: hypothetical protein ABIW50_06090 [Candidatus Limnocylindria bacterium]
MSARPGVGERVYRGFLRLYPREFRERFSDEMVVLFRDRLRDARAEGLLAGRTAAWLTMLADVTVTAMGEQLQRRRTVAHSIAATPSIPARALGIVGMLGGIALLAAFVVDIPSELNALRIILFNLGAVAVVIAVTVSRRHALSPALVVGGLAALLANALFVGMVLTWSSGLPLFWAGLAMWVGNALFGVAVLRIGGRSRIGGLALVIGGPLALTGIDRLGLTSPATPTIFGPLSLAGIALVGVGWIVLGADVVARRRLVAPPDR